MQPRQPITYTFSELLSRTFRIYRENFAAIIGLVAFVTIPISLLTIIVAPQPLALLPDANGTIPQGADTAALLVNLLTLLQTVLISAPLTYLVSESLFNHKLSISEAFSGVSHRLSQIGCGVLFVGFVLGILAVFLVFLMLIFPPALALGGIVLHMIIAASALMFPVLTLENINPTAVINRSWSLGKRRFWTVLGISLVVVVITFIISSLIASALDALLAAVAPNMNINLQFLIASIVSDIISIFVAPLSPIAFTLLYYDIRAKTESLDTQLTSSATRPLDLPIPASRFQLDSNDWRNIIILSLIGLVLGLVANSLIQQLLQTLSPGLR